MAGGALGLAAYRALSRRGFAGRQVFSTPRPEGELIWLHVPTQVAMDGALCVADRLIEHRPGCYVLVTQPVGAGDRDLPEGVLTERLAADHPSTALAFLNHWRPDIGLWLGGWLAPNLIDAARRAEVPLLLLWAQEDGFDGRRDRWLPELSGHLLRQFDEVSAVDDPARQRLHRLGLLNEQITQPGALLPVGRVLTCDATDQEELAQAFTARPVWLAAGLQPSEVDTVLAAHRDVLRRQHRLILLLVPATPEAHDRAVAQIAETELRVADWSVGALPSENDNVLLASDAEDLGLWYRLASVTLMGGTLTNGAPGRDPLEPAALGTALLYGPHPGQHLAAYSRLTQAGGARIVNSAQSLAGAVSALIAPDKAAMMAHAGWDVATEGSPAIDQAVGWAQEALDRP